MIPNQLAAQILGPGVYSLGAANLASGGLLTLSGNGTYIFRVASSLTTISTSNILLAAGAQSCNIWWQVGSSATLGGTTFAGNVIGLTGTNSMGPNATLDGRLLTTVPGVVTLAGDNTVTAVSCLAPAALGPVGVTKSFVPNVNVPGGGSLLTVNFTNNNAAAATLTSSFVDVLPSGVVLAAVPAALTNCGGSVVAVPGGTSLILSAGSTIPGGAPGSCSMHATVTGATPGTYINTLPANSLQTSNGNNSVPGVAIFTVIAAASVPTLTEWATMLLAALLGVGGFFALRRRSQLR